MTNHQDLFKELKEALLDLVTQGADHDLKTDLKIAIDRFFDAELYTLTEEEWAVYLDTPEKLVHQFNNFLDNSLDQQPSSDSDKNKRKVS